jgi:hypothetical protein
MAHDQKAQPQTDDRHKIPHAVACHRTPPWLLFFIFWHQKAMYPDFSLIPALARRIFKQEE